MEGTVSIDLERQKEAKEYARIRRRLMLVDLLLGGVYTLAWLLLGWSSKLKEILLAYTTSPWLLVLGFGFVFGTGYLLLGLPLSYYSGFVLPHRYGLSNQTLRIKI